MSGFLARKIYKRANIEKIKGMTDEEIEAIPVTEARKWLHCTEDSLSAWRIDDLEQSNIHNAAKAICLASQRIDTFHIIMLKEDSILSKFQICTSLGRTGAKNLASIHRDIVNICDENILHIIKLYKEAALADHLYRYSRATIRPLIHDMYHNEEIDLENVPETLKKDIVGLMQAK